MSWKIIYVYFHVIMLFTVVTSYQDIAQALPANLVYWSWCKDVCVLLVGLIHHLR